MSVEHGTLSLLAQPRPSFQVTGNGTFDTGYRRFQVYQSRLASFLDGILKVGTTDQRVLAHAQDPQGFGHPRMVIASREIEEEESNHAIIGVRYEGLLGFKKDAAISHSTSIEQQAPFLWVSGTALNIRNKVNVPKPTVEHRWVSTTGKPSLLDTGVSKTPPGISAQETARLAQYYDNFTADGQATIFEGWVLISRTMRSPGNILKSKVWEVIDIFEWTVLRYKP